MQPNNEINYRNYPFTAIVGQEKMKEALILNAINPMIGGVLLRGDKGTGKTTAVRSLIDILPEIEVSDCIFGCSPDNLCDLCKNKPKKNLNLKKRRMKIVELPLSATEDRVVGSIDIERALREGLKAFQPGILAEANNNILYIDEVNLLEDHLVDTLLDAAASGWNVVEREGISVKHPSKFILVGTMNPEEGELRPQLLDRFGMVVDVRAINDADLRAEVIKRAEEFADNPVRFYLKFKEKQEKLKRRISLAREILKEVTASKEIIHAVAELCSELEIETHRADITTIRAAKALTAYKGRKEVKIEDVKEVAELTLPHRMKSKPFEEPKLDFDKIESMLNEKTDAKEKDDDKSKRGEEENFNDFGKEQKERKGSFKNVEKDHKISKANLPEVELSVRKKAAKGRRVKSVSDTSGKYIDFRMRGKDIAIGATLRAAAIRGLRRPSRQDLRYKAYVGKVASSIALVVDASGSMASLKRMEVAKGVLLKLLQDAYIKKDRISLIIFKDKKAEVVVPPTPSPQYALKRLVDITTGGKTPLSAGLLKGFETLKYEKRKNRIPLLVLITDGRANISIEGDVKKEILKISEKIAKEGILTVVFDADDYISLGFTQEICEITKGLYYRLKDLNVEKISDVVDDIRFIPS